MKISATVMAHPDRAKHAKALERKLTKMPFTDVYTIYDDSNSEWDTGSRALKWGLGKADYHLVIQDDAVLTPGFYDNLEAAITAAPHKSLISLYTGRVRPLPSRVQAAVDKAAYVSWLRYHLLLWGVAIVIPTDHIEPMLDYVADRNDLLYDTRIGIFYQGNMIPVLYTVPSLVDHNDKIGSLLAHGGTDEPRVAHKLATGPLDWNSKYIDI